MSQSSHPTRRRALVALVALVVAGCSDLAGPGTGAVLELSRARAKWREQRLTTYSYDFRRSCFCLETTTAPVRLLVVGGDVTEVVALEGWHVPASLEPSYYPTVDELFSVVEEAIRERVAHLVVEYDEAYGYPRLIEIDRGVDYVDDELTLWGANLVSPQESPLARRGR